MRHEETYLSKIMKTLANHVPKNQCIPAGALMRVITNQEPSLFYMEYSYGSTTSPTYTYSPFSIYEGIRREKKIAEVDGFKITCVIVIDDYYPMPDRLIHVVVTMQNSEILRGFTQPRNLRKLHA